MLTIDGSRGEGGGQILRTALALSLVTGTPFRIENIRGGRPRPGLLRQHQTAVEAAAAVGAAEVEGATLGSRDLRFRPRSVRPGRYHFAIGTAGSTSLVAQTVLPALLVAPGPSTLSLEGGTHNPGAPPFDFLERVFFPLVGRMGPRVEAVLDRAGFHPAGGGRCAIRITPAPRLEPLVLVERGAVTRRSARALVARLSRAVADRELAVVGRGLGWSGAELEAVVLQDAGPGPGNVLLLEVQSEHVTELFTGFGERGVPAETVARRAVEETRRYLAAGVPVGSHLADQLLVLLAVIGAGAFRTTALSSHARSNLAVIRAFDPATIAVTGQGDDIRVECRRGPTP